MPESILHDWTCLVRFIALKDNAEYVGEPLDASIDGRR
jgi:hypothetical protein